MLLSLDYFPFPEEQLCLTALCGPARGRLGCERCDWRPPPADWHLRTQREHTTPKSLALPARTGAENDEEVVPKMHLSDGLPRGEPRHRVRDTPCPAIQKHLQAEAVPAQQFAVLQGSGSAASTNAMTDTEYTCPFSPEQMKSAPTRRPRVLRTAPGDHAPQRGACRSVQALTPGAAAAAARRAPLPPCSRPWQREASRCRLAAAPTASQRRKRIPASMANDPRVTRCRQSRAELNWWTRATLSRVLWQSTRTDLNPDNCQVPPAAT